MKALRKKGTESNPVWYHIIKGHDGEYIFLEVSYPLDSVFENDVSKFYLSKFYGQDLSDCDLVEFEFKEAAPEPTEEEIDQAAVSSIRYDNYALSFKDGAYWCKQKTNRK
ncbi:hypothetical protein [Pedobacter sp.]|uniref:hypothetical protein n=1 Tax=Pedobacter sp. TaxID=1411316 RepID=UPI003C359CBD